MYPAGDISPLFSWADYLVLGIVLALSAAVGVFFGFYKKQKDSNAYLLAEQSMGVTPVALSLLASFMSGVSLIGLSSEAYTAGTSIWMASLVHFIVIPITILIYLPVYWKLQMTLYMAVVVYAPALALAQVANINLVISVMLTCFICIFYTALGGIKAVIWTDVLQGTITVGGFSQVWEKNKESGRLEWFIWDFDLTVRHTFWVILPGNTLRWLAVFATNQAQVQRYMCVKKQSMAVKALLVNAVGIPILSWLCIYAGMLAYAKYWDCDPLSTHKISKADQVFPLFVMEVLGKFKGLPGCFLAAVFSGTLSTISSGINALAAMTQKDIIPLFAKEMSPSQEVLVSKILSLGYGLLCFALVFVMDKLGSVITITIIITGSSASPILGLFSLGMLFPFANKYGALVGTVSSLCICLWLGIGGQLTRVQNDIYPYYKPFSTEGCLYDNFSAPLTSTTMMPTYDHGPEESVFIGYRLSYYVFGALGCIITIALGVLVSLITGGQDLRKLDPRTLSPVTLWIGKKCNVLKDLGIDTN